MLALFAGLLWLGAIMTRALYRPPVIIYTHGDESRPAIALTFDDGPSARFTPQILNILAAYQVRATFFLLGRHARCYPGLVRALVAQGHEIGNHTYSHPHLSGVAPAILAQELEKTTVVLRRLGVPTPSLFRPPYSELTAATTRFLARRGWKIILGNVDSGDWQGHSAAEIAAQVERGLKNGAIVIFHDNNENDDADRQPTVEALRLLLPRMQAAGFRCLTVSALLWRRFSAMDRSDDSREGRTSFELVNPRQPRRISCRIP